jgi:hypothetical protein
MRRREFITLVGSAAAWPIAARAQQPAMPVVGFFHTGLPEMFADETAAFRRGLPGSKATSRAKGSHRKLGGLVSGRQSCVRGTVRIGKARSRSR